MDDGFFFNFDDGPEPGPALLMLDDVDSITDAEEEDDQSTDAQGSSENAYESDAYDAHMHCEDEDQMEIEHVMGDLEDNSVFLRMLPLPSVLVRGVATGADEAPVRGQAIHLEGNSSEESIPGAAGNRIEAPQCSASEYNREPGAHGDDILDNDDDDDSDDDEGRGDGANAGIPSPDHVEYEDSVPQYGLYYNRAYARCMDLSRRTNEVSDAFLANNNVNCNAPYIPDGILEASKARARRLTADGFRASEFCPFCALMGTPREEYIKINPVSASIISRFYTTRFTNREAFLTWAVKFWKSEIVKHMPSELAELYSATYSQAENHFFYTCMRDGAQIMHDTLMRIEAFEDTMVANALQQEVINSGLTGTVVVHKNNMSCLQKLWSIKNQYVKDMTALSMQAEIIAHATIKRKPLLPEDARSVSQSASVFNKFSKIFCAQEQEMCDVV